MASPPKKGGKDQGCEFQDSGNYWGPFQKLSAPVILIQEVWEMPLGHTFLMSNSSDPDTDSPLLRTVGTHKKIQLAT